MTRSQLFLLILLAIAVSTLAALAVAEEPMLSPTLAPLPVLRTTTGSQPTPPSLFRAPGKYWPSGSRMAA